MILITGATGFVGKHLTEILDEKDFLGIGSAICDITNFEQVSKIVEKTKPEIIIHAAAIANPETCRKNKDLAYKVNFEGTENILKASENFAVEKIVLMSTGLVYKASDEKLKEEDELIEPEKADFYVKTKLWVEELSKDYKNSIIVRTFNQEGPGRPLNITRAR